MSYKRYDLISLMPHRQGRPIAQRPHPSIWLEMVTHLEAIVNELARRIDDLESSHAEEHPYQPPLLDDASD